jgi:hypothetical protein
MSTKNQKYPLLNRWKEENDITDDIKYVGFVTARENKIWCDPSWTMSNNKFETRSQSDKNWRNKNVISAPPVECNTPQFNHNFNISTSYSISNKEYLDVERVFYYVTLGGIINKNDMLEVREWVKRSVDAYNRSKKITTEIQKIYVRVSRPFDGKDDVYQIRRYMPEHYSAIAKGCINWATLNTHKITYPSI